MGWEAVAAIASAVSAMILVVASIAAVLQLKHLRLANQIEAVLVLSQQLQSDAMVEARRYLASRDFRNPNALREAIDPHLDRRIVAIGVHFQTVARMINLGILDKRLLSSHLAIASEIWESLRPIAYALREREANPRWIDLEYLVYRITQDRSIVALASSYEPAFLENSGLQGVIERCQDRATRAAAK